MWLEIRIPHKFAGADSCAVDYKIEIAIDFFEFFEVNLPIDCVARSQQTRSEIIEIDRGVRERDSDSVAAGKFTAFDSVTFGSLRLLPSRPCRGFPSPIHALTLIGKRS